MDKLHLVTGYKGEEHIQSADQGSFNASFFGGGEYVMEAGNQFEASIMDNNTVRILDGDALMKGRHLRIEPNTYADITIQTGTAGVNRNDLIVFQYSKDTATGIEDSNIVVVRGTETSGTATDPTYTQGDILGGATFNQMPMYRVKVEGVVLTGIEPLFTVIPTYKTLAERYARQFQEACNTYIGLLNILDTMEEVEANTQEGQLAGALSVKELKNTLQSAIDTKVTNSFTANRVLTSNSSGKVAVNPVTTTELGFLSGVNDYIQNQLNYLKICKKATSTQNNLGLTLTTNPQYLLTNGSGSSSNEDVMTSQLTGVYIKETGNYDIEISVAINSPTEDTIRIGFRDFKDTDNYNDLYQIRLSKGYHHISYHTMGNHIVSGHFVRPIIYATNGGSIAGSCSLTVIKR